MGLSSGVIDGWKFARPDSEALGAMDADFSHDPRIFPPMVRALESGEYGLAIGSRYVKGGGIRNWPLRRKITSRVAIALAKPLTPVQDITSGYLLVKRDALEGVELDPIGFKIGLEVIAKAHYGRGDRGAVRLYGSRCGHVEAQSERDPQLLATVAPHLCLETLMAEESEAAAA